MAEKRGGLTGRTGRRVIVEVSKDGFATAVSPTKPGGNSFEVPGINSFAIGTGEAPSDTTPSFEGSFTTLGEAPVGDVNFAIVSYIPNHPAWAMIEDAHENSNILRWKIKTPPKVIFGPSAGLAKADIVAATGEVNLAGGNAGVSLTDQTVQRGMVLKIGSKSYTIVSVDDVADKMYVIDNVTGIPPALAVATAFYTILIPSLLWEFSGGVKQTGGSEGGVDSAIGSTLVVTPTSRIPLPIVVE